MDIESFVCIFLIGGGVAGLLLERFGRRNYPVTRAHSQEVATNKDDGHAPELGEPFTISYGEGFDARGVSVSPIAYAELYEKIDALNLVPGSDEWEVYAERMALEREREEIRIEYGDWS